MAQPEITFAWSVSVHSIFVMRYTTSAVKYLLHCKNSLISAKLFGQRGELAKNQ